MPSHVTDLIPAYALDSLDEDEAVQVSEHVASCSACRAELRSYQAVVDELAFAAPDAAPSPVLKGHIMDQVERHRAIPSPEPATSWRQRVPDLMRRTAPVWGLASLVLIAALLISNLLLWQRISGPGMRTVELTGTQAAPEATGTIVISKDGRHGTLVVDRLPPLGGEREYQLWLIKDGQRTSGAVFSVNGDSYGTVWVSAAEPLFDYSAFGVTVEPAGGSPGPTGNKVLGGTF